MGRYYKLVWIAFLSAGLTLLALLVGDQKPVGADVNPTAATRNTQHATRNTRNWHTIYLPLVSRQESLAPRLYRLTIDPVDLSWLYDNYWTYETVPAVFTYKDVSYDVQVRFRGGTARNMPKKSWKIDFPASTPFEGQRELNLNAEYTDKSLLREALAYDLFERAGLPASRTKFARLEINGQSMGLFLQVEQVDERFLDRIGWNPNDNLYKGNYGNFELSGDYQGYVNSYLKRTNREDSHDDIIAFVEMINHTPEADFPTALAAVMDVGEYLDWVAVHILLGDFEWLEKNYYLYHQLDEDQWTFLPWDLDLLLGHNWHWGPDSTLDPDISWDNPIDSGTEDSKKADGKWNKLVTEVLQNEDFRFAYCRRLWELMNDEFAAAVMYQRIDTFYNPIIPYAEADPYKWGDNADFHNGPDELKTYVSNRLDWLTEQIPTYCPDSGPMPLINELMSDNATTLADEAGECEPWIELYNPGLVSFDVGGMGLSGQPLADTPQWTIPEGTVIPPDGFLLIWADAEPGDGPFHTNFRLDVDGGTVTLLDKAVHGGQVVAQQTYGPLGPDFSFGRIRDGDGAWITFHPATPGWSNLGRAPLITATTHTPTEPGDNQPVTVASTVTGEAAEPTVSLYWSDDGAPQISPMYDDGAHGDGAAGDGRYGATIPALSNGTVVTYYVRAQDSAGLVSTDPPRAPAVAYSYIVGFQRPSLYLNELVAINQGTLDDEAGESDDWFEIYNASPTDVSLGGMYLTDAIENTTKCQIPTGVTVPAGDHVIFWADDQSEQGPTHINFKLDGDGERLALYAGPDNYNGLIDEIYYGPQTVDESLGRYPDGGATWRVLIPTPGQANQQPPPTISDLRHSPASPLTGQTVTVISMVQDDDSVASATLYYNTGSGFQAVPMQPIAGILYSAQIPPQAGGVTVAYYVRAQDDLGGAATYPKDAPAVTYGYQVGYTPPPLFINEFLASNDSVNQDETGAYEDWVELYNGGTESLDVGGMYLTDDLSRPTKWRLPDGTVIPAGGFLLIWTDDDEEDGPLHAGFKLSKDGEEIGLFDRDSAANTLIDSVVFGPQATDVSTGRSPDGGETWTTFDLPTPGGRN
jgi:spore coat protein CotH